MPDEAVQKMLSENPLLLFSVYTQAQVQDLSLVRRELSSIKPKKRGDGSYFASDFGKYYALFWLWVLGAYEVLRTMSENEDCFDKATAKEISEQKRKIAKLRMPFAKQQLCGENRKNGPTQFYAENSAVGVGTGYIFEVGDEVFDSETMMDQLLDFFSGIKRDQILKEIPVNRPRFTPIAAIRSPRIPGNS